MEGLTQKQKQQDEKRYEMERRLSSRHLVPEVVDYALDNIDPQTDSGKIALKCTDCVFCIRDHVGYENYRISDRSQCPKTCALNK